MSRNRSIQIIFNIILLLPFFLAAEDYFPLAVGNWWDYSFVQPAAEPEYHRIIIDSDTTIGQRHYYKRLWISLDTSTSWLYVSGTPIIISPASQLSPV